MVPPPDRKRQGSHVGADQVLSIPRVALAAAALGGARRFSAPARAWQRARTATARARVAGRSITIQGRLVCERQHADLCREGRHAAKETYRLHVDGSIDTTFTFRANAFDGPELEYHPRGLGLAPNNAVCDQHYVWLFKADYRISYLAADYGQTVVMREKRDCVWIMARTPALSKADLQELIAFVGRQGYDTSKQVPQQAGG
jgi:lipocalin